MLKRHFSLIKFVNIILQYHLSQVNMSLYSLLLIKSINLVVLLLGIFPFFHSNPKSLVISGLTGISTKSLGFTARDEYRNAPQFPPLTKFKIVPS